VINGSTDADVVTRVRNYMSAGQLENAATATVTVNRGVALTGSDTASQITINYPFQFMVLNPVVRLVTKSSTTGAPITMQSTSLMRNES
jgi:integral membrane sensor domain MASE1